ncbi:unnamed protein product [Paramecium pentaurelia]|uniref:Uncharacterized protein n=1 Tax=Paramecium pentaurelia TaxID=43138 RepID=A0A8S1SNM0_9CILI|nr:unnamed protein product [Paramecium pentaurelia]
MLGQIREGKYKYVFLQSDKNDEIIVTRIMVADEVQKENKKISIEEIEQNQRQNLKNKENTICNLKEIKKKNNQIQENQFKFMESIFQQDDKYCNSLKKQFKKTILSNILNQGDNEVDLQIKIIKEIDNNIQEISEMLCKRKNVPISLNMYDRILNIMDKKYNDIKKLNSLILQKQESVTKILQRLKQIEKALKSQQDIQKIKQDKIQLELVYKNVEKYFTKLNFHFNNTDLQKQIEELEKTKKIYEDQNQELNQTITILEQELQNEKAQAQNLITQLNQELQNEKDKTSDVRKKQKEEEENEKAKTLQQITKIKQELQNEKDQSKKQQEQLENEKVQALSQFYKLQQELKKVKEQSEQQSEKLENEKIQALSQIKQLQQELQKVKDQTKKQQEELENYKAQPFNQILQLQLQQELQIVKDQAKKYKQELENEKAQALSQFKQFQQELQKVKEQSKQQSEKLENEKIQALNQIKQLQQELQNEKNKLLFQEQKLQQKLHRKDYAQNFLKEQNQQFNNHQLHKINEQMLKQLNQVNIQLKQNDNLLSINEEQQLSWIDSQLPEIQRYQNLSSNGFAIIQLFINSIFNDSQSYFGLCDQNIDNSEIQNINFQLNYLPKGVYFFISMQGNLLIQDPNIKKKLKIGGFENGNHALFTFDSPNNRLTILKNNTYSEQFKFRLPKNNKTVIPFILQAYGEDLTLIIQ